MKRHQLVLTGLLVVQLILGVVAFWPRRAAGAQGAPVFPGLAVSGIVDLSITDSSGNRVHIGLVDGEWLLVDAGGYPVRSEQASVVLEGIVGLNAGRLVTRTDLSHRRLQVADDEFVRRVEFQTTDGTKHAFYLGSTPNSGATHFRVEGQSEVYLTAGLTPWRINTTVASWIDIRYLDVPRETVVRFALENANGAFVLTRSASAEAGVESWTMEGLGPDERVDDGKLVSLLTQATSIGMVEPLGQQERAEYGLARPTAVVTLETSDGQTVTVVVGASDAEAQNYVVKASASPYYVRVAQWSLSFLLDHRREDFLTLPTTPMPEGGASGQ